jgi:hypothetical protein
VQVHNLDGQSVAIHTPETIVFQVLCEFVVGLLGV